MRKKQPRATGPPEDPGWPAPTGTHGRSASPGCLLVSGAQYTQTADCVFSRGLFLAPGREPIPFGKQFPSQAVGERGFVHSGRFLPVVEHHGVHLAEVSTDWPEFS